MADDTILLVEDNPDDEDLTLRALEQNHIKNAVVVARDWRGSSGLFIRNRQIFRPRRQTYCPTLFCWT